MNPTEARVAEGDGGGKVDGVEIMKTRDTGERGSDGAVATGGSVLQQEMPADELAVAVQRVTSTLTPPTDQELEHYGTVFKHAVQEIELLQAKTDRTTVERYYQCGQFLLELGRRLRDKTKFMEWQKSQATRPGQLEVFRQMRKIASMGTDVLRYAYLGKNRVLELYYLVRELEEANDGSLKPESLRRRLRELEASHPFPAYAALSHQDVDECRVHMDAIITQYRLERAFDVTDVVSFEDAKRIARVNKIAIERKSAGNLAKKLSPVSDKRAAIKNWVENGMKADRSPGVDDSTRVTEILVKINQEVAALTGDETRLNALRNNPLLQEALRDAYASVQALHDKLMGRSTAEIGGVA